MAQMLEASFQISPVFRLTKQLVTTSVRDNMKYPKLTLVYFPNRGNTEKIRLAMAAAKIPFTNKAVTHSEFEDMRATLPLGQLPVLEIEQDDGGVKVVPQSDAILRYVGSRSECLYPPAKALEIDSLIDTMTEFITPFVISFIGPVTALIADEEWTEADKMAMRKRILMTQIPKYFGYFEKILQENHESGWLVGEKLSIADLKWYGIVTNLQTGVVDGIPADVTDEYPRITEHIQKVRSVPEIKAWYDRFPQTPYPTFDYESPSSYSE